MKTATKRQIQTFKQQVAKITGMSWQEFTGYPDFESYKLSLGKGVEYNDGFKHFAVAYANPAGALIVKIAEDDADYDEMVDLAFDRTLTAKQMREIARESPYWSWMLICIHDSGDPAWDFADSSDGWY